MSRRFTYLAWTLLTLAIIAWIAVAYFAQAITAQEDARAAALEAQQQSSDAQSSSVRLHALAQDTEPDRTTLEGDLAVGIAPIANTLKNAGTSAGVDLTLSGALPEPASSSGGSDSVGAVGFVVEGTGTFSALMRTVQLLETLPLPSSVQQLDIQQIPDPSGKPGETWHLNANILVLTTSSISS
jgi:hypothetical protein